MIQLIFLEFIITCIVHTILFIFTSSYEIQYYAVAYTFHFFSFVMFKSKFWCSFTKYIAFCVYGTLGFVLSNENIYVLILMYLSILFLGHYVIYLYRIYNFWNDVILLAENEELIVKRFNIVKKKIKSTCDICFEDIEFSCKIKNDNCSSNFCEGCLTTWFIESDNFNCPICRFSDIENQT